MQVVNTVDTDMATGTTVMPIDDTIPQITEGDEYMTLDITPNASTNRLKIEVLVNASSSAAANAIVVALFKDSTANALSTGWNRTQTADGPTQIKLVHDMVADTTSSITFRVRVGAQSAGTVTVNGIAGARYFGGVLQSSITVTEYNA